jgi:hypothetical protein
MQYGYEVHKFRTDVQHGHAVIDMRHGHAAWTNSRDMQQRYAYILINTLVFPPAEWIWTLEPGFSVPGLIALSKLAPRTARPIKTRPTTTRPTVNSPRRQLAPWITHPMDNSPLVQFAPGTTRPITTRPITTQPRTTRPTDNSPHGQLAPRTTRPTDNSPHDNLPRYLWQKVYGVVLYYFINTFHWFTLHYCFR